MPERITIGDASKHVGETVRIPGWLYNLRKSGKIVFPLLRDGTGLMQCVAVKSALPEAVFDTIKDLTQESSVVFTGKIRADQRAPGGYEMDVESVDVLQHIPESDPYPITPKDHGVDFLMDHRHLWLRSQRQHAILRVRHEVIRAVRDYFDSHGFTLVDTPIFTPAACEGTTTTKRRIWRSPGSFITKRRRLRSGTFIASGPHFERRNRRRGGTSPSSGWWNRRWPTRRLKTSSALPSK
jgi:asparaginyl-tRNA synthetase